MIEDKYRPQAQRAADLLYTALAAVEDCGADVALTNIVMELSRLRRDLKDLFGLDQAQVVKPIRPDDIYPLGEFRLAHPPSEPQP